MVFYGASGHAKVVIEALLASGGKVTGIFDDDETITGLMNYIVSGKYDPGRFPNSEVVLSIGSNAVRKKLAGLLSCHFGKVIHPFTSVSPSASVGAGSVVMAGVVVNADTHVGRHVILNTTSSIDHDCRIGDFVHVSPNATICGGVILGEGVHVGAGATVIQNITVGKWAVIGAGSVIIEDVPDYAVVMGVPGRVVRVGDRE